MEAKNRLHQEIEARVAAWTGEIFAGRVETSGDGQRVRFGSAVVEVSVAPWGEREAVIVVRAAVVRGAALGADLLEHLLRKNSATKLGAFGIGVAGDIEFRHSITGSACQREELEASIRYVMLTADLCDDEIVSRWGGRRATDG